MQYIKGQCYYISCTKVSLIKIQGQFEPIFHIVSIPERNGFMRLVQYIIIIWSVTVVLIMFNKHDTI